MDVIEYCKTGKGALRHQKIEKADFSGQRFSYIDFRGSKLINCNFAKSSIRYSSFWEAELINCNFTNANLSGVCWGAATLTGCNFAGTILEGYAHGIAPDCVFNPVKDGRLIVGYTTMSLAEWDELFSKKNAPGDMFTAERGTPGFKRIFDAYQCVKRYMLKN